MWLHLLAERAGAELVSLPRPAGASFRAASRAPVNTCSAGPCWMPTW
jgi:hypothetical protein